MSALGISAGACVHTLACAFGLTALLAAVIVLAADIRLAAEGAVFSVREVDVGMVADVGTLQRLPRLIGEGQARELAYTGRTLNGPEAEKLGLANRLFATPAELEAGVRQIARSIAAKSPLAIRGTKEVLNYSRDHSIADGLNFVATWNAATLLSSDLKECMQAQMEKRAPQFAD